MKKDLVEYNFSILSQKKDQNVIGENKEHDLKLTIKPTKKK